NSNYTTGITRNVSNLTNITVETDDIALKNIVRWNPTKYLNIWVIQSITSLSAGTGVAGYAYFPSSHGQPEDGVVIESDFGSSPENSKIAIHEIGHYLGLYHTFEGGCGNGNCLIDGDKVCDTPPDASTAPVSCASTINTCTTDSDDISVNNPFRPTGNGGVGDQNDMYINYMDYGYQTCKSAFTLGQKNRMLSFLTGIRNSLLQSTACNSLCSNPITSFFNSSATNVVAGTSVSFTNTSSGATNYIWQLNGTTFSNLTNSTYTFNTQGTYAIKLIASNNDISCNEEYTQTIIVTCPVLSSFTLSSNIISPGDNVTFTNTSINGTSYQWYIDGVTQSSATNFNYTFPTAGGFMVSLVASNGTCSDTFYSYISVGQCNSKEANTWYFGDSAGVDFNGSSPVALTNSAMFTFEGCASISDKVNGQLLFYTDGITVWNKNHIPMPNGLGLMGHTSAMQSALIVPKPNNNGKYYIFTVDANENNYANGLRYSEVDMALDSGLGDVISGTKNTLLVTPVTENLVGGMHCNGNDIWILTHKYFDQNIFYSFLVTATGVSSTPVVSSIYIPNSGTIGGLWKLSPAGNKLAHTNYMLDFDNTTGILSNLVDIGQAYQMGISLNYGVEFSPDGSKLYRGGYFSGSSSPKKIFQIDLQAGSVNDINNSIIEVGASSYSSLGALQIAPDGKIYVSKIGDSVLGVINNPNAIGLLCNYIDNGLSLNGKIAYLGLPNFASNVFYNGVPYISGPDSVCNESATYTLRERCFNSINWSLLGDGYIQNSSDSLAVIHFNSSGKDTLIAEVTSNCGIKRDSMFITVLQYPLLELGADTIICQGSSITLNAGNGYTSYLWQDGTSNQTYTVNTPGNYKVTVNTGNSCTTTDSITINLAQPANILDLGLDIISCNGRIVVLNAGSDFSSYEWQDGSLNQKFTVYQPGKYWVTVSSCGNTKSDTINVLWQNNFPSSIIKEGSLCAGESVTLKANPINLESYIWDDGTSSTTRLVDTPGIYLLTITSANGCYNQDSIDVLLSDCNCTMGVPTAFSPDGDGHNDMFVLHGFENCVSNFSLIIFDRWGEKVFEAENASVSWTGFYNGKLLNPGVFVYYMEATLNNGQSINKKGNISLIR
ncbi:MAG: M43 family zinc metalloprotease, partial [Bacteroidia bacterium]